MAEDKKPDNIVWNEKEGYNSSLLPYGTNVGAPAISHDDVATWKSQGVNKTNRQFSAKYEEIKAEYLKLIDEYRWNDLVYKSSYSFEPVIGETYYLYSKSTGDLFLSLIHPSEWKQKDYIGSFRLESTLKWVKVD
jgi:hypothetical protein